MNEDIPCYRCFICWDDIDFEDTSTKVVSACNCISVDFKYTHKDCLNLWINQNRRAGLKCQVCGAPFHIKKVLKPFKKIYKENWKRINCLLLGIILLNSLLWMLCVQWKKELEKINSGQNHHLDNNGVETVHLEKYDEWINNYDERESYLEEFINNISFNEIFQNIYVNATTLFLFINTLIFALYFYHEKEKFYEYSIDEKYEYKPLKNSFTDSKYFGFSNQYHHYHYHYQNNNNTIPNNDHLLPNDNNNIYNNYSNYEYQKIRII